MPIWKALLDSADCLFARHLPWLSGALSQALIFLTLLGCGRMVYRRLIKAEEKGAERLLSVACFVCILSLALVCTGKLAFSVALSSGVILAIRRVSVEKFRFLHLHLHIYDFALLAQGRSTGLFLFRTVPWLLAGCFLRGLLAILLLALIMVRERFMVSPLAAGLLFVVSSVVALLAWRRVSLLPVFWQPKEFRLSAFLLSIPETIQVLKQGGVLACEGAGWGMPRLDMGGAKEPTGANPTILVILNESTFPPDLFRATPVEAQQASFFRSADGRARHLRVETFGGGTWMSAFSLMTGIPASTYGRLRAHALCWAKGRIRHSLPATLKGFGYRSVVLSPLGGDFLGEEPFYRSLGFDEFLDQKDLGAQRDREPDAFYLSKALRWLEKHFAQRDHPAFLFLMTIANHHPHGGAAHPGGGEPFNDYLQRLKGTARDYETFKTSLKSRFPDQSFLILHFGDHQPPFTCPEQEAKNQSSPGAGQLDEERAYLTYFAVDGVGFEPRQLDHTPDLLEIAYLGTVVLSAAGLPLDGVHKLRWDLALRNEGRLFFADSNGALARQMNQRLIEAGLMDAH